MTTLRTTLLAGASLALLSIAVPAAAQDATRPANPPGAQSDAADTSDIIITANKREQNLSDVGMAVAVLPADAIKERQLTTLADIASAVPGLIYTNSAENTPIYTLRGVSFYDSSLGAYAAVSLNIDEAAMPFPVLAQHTAFDLERVEVLKGPQGTLFGQNATGGAVNFITAKPTSTFRAGADVTYGRFNEVTAEGYVSGPLSDTLKARLAGRIERADPWQESNSRPGDKNGRVENYVGRLLLDFEPANGVRFQANLNAWKDKGDTQAAQYIGFQPAGAGRTPALLKYQFAWSPARLTAADWAPGVPFADNRQFQGTFRADIALFSNVTLTSLTSYTDYKQRQGTDQDGLPIAEADHARNNGRIKAFNSELRLSNGGAAGFRWVLGGNYERSSVFQIVDTSYADSSSFGSLGIRSNTYSSDQVMHNYAAFGNVEFDIGDRITLKGGARYTRTKDEGTSCINDLSGIPGNSGDFFYRVLLGGRFGPYPRGACFAINDRGTTINGVAPGAPGAYAATLEEHNVSWRAGIDWKPVKGMLLYANVAKGYKAGSFPTATGSTFTSYLPVTQESVLAYEGGIKASLLGRTLQLELSGFYYDYRNKQIRAKVARAPFGILDALVNIPKSSIRGFEATADIRPIRGLDIPLSFSYIDARIDTYTGINGAGVTGVFDGTRMPYTPKIQFSINPNYEFGLGSDTKAFVGASLNFRSDAIAVIGGDRDAATVVAPDRPVARIDDYALLDLRAGLRFAGDRYRVSVYAKNVFNTYYWTNVFNTTDTVERLAGRPSTYGISLGFRY